MAELLSSNSKSVVHVSPVWPKPKRRKSFQHVVNKLLKVLRFVQIARNRPLMYEISEQRKDCADKNLTKEERLEKVKGLAKLKKDGAEERKLNGWKFHREKLRYLEYLERMSPVSISYWKNEPTRKVLSIGKLKLFNTREKKSESFIWMKNLETHQTVKEFKLKESSNGVASVMSRRGADSIPARGRSNHSNVRPSTISKAVEVKSQLSSLDAKLDPRFQSLLRSLTPMAPIDC
ncbi:uncharacterized protein LOC144658851 [Oculina patagonica]